MQQQAACGAGSLRAQYVADGETGAGTAPPVGLEGCCCVQGWMLEPVTNAYRHQSGATPSVFCDMRFRAWSMAGRDCDVFFVHYSE